MRNNHYVSICWLFKHLITGFVINLQNQKISLKPGLWCILSLKKKKLNNQKSSFREHIIDKISIFTFIYIDINVLI